MITLTEQETEELDIAVDEHSHDFGTDWDDEYKSLVESAFLRKYMKCKNAVDSNGDYRGVCDSLETPYEDPHDRSYWNRTAP